jgi:hypothetical protein
MFETAHSAENVQDAQVKSSQTAKFRPIWSHWYYLPKKFIIKERLAVQNKSSLLLKSF